MPYILSPVSGRDYKNQKEVLKDFHDNKDFILEATDEGPNFGGRYCSKNWIPQGKDVELRYQRKSKVVMIYDLQH